MLELLRTCSSGVRDVCVEGSASSCCSKLEPIGRTNDFFPAPLCMSAAETDVRNEFGLLCIRAVLSLAVVSSSLVLGKATNSTPCIS